MTAHYLPAGTVYGTLLNFSGECEAMAEQMTQPPYQAAPEAPVLFIKTANTWSANGATVTLPTHVRVVEVGATVGMVMGPRTRADNSARTSPTVAGYVLLNDLSVPHASFFRPPVKFKCLDGFLGIGPLLLGAQQAGDPASFKLLVRINGRERQAVDFAHTVRSAAQLLAEVDAFMTLRQGDVLALGCDTGRPLAEAGDLVDISAPDAPGFGVLSNTLVAENP